MQAIAVRGGNPTATLKWGVPLEPAPEQSQPARELGAQRRRRQPRRRETRVSKSVLSDKLKCSSKHAVFGSSVE